MLKNAIIICSEPRGGSTWLMEILQSMPKTVVNMEPLHHFSGVVPARFNLGWYPYIPQENNEIKYLRFFKAVLTFKVYNRWTTGKVGIKKLLSAKRVLTKFVLANRLLPWLTLHFNHKLSHWPIYLVRHPIPTCISQLRNFHGIQKERLLSVSATNFKVPNGIFNDRFKEHETYLASLSSSLERHIALWCINNVAIMDHPNKAGWITVYYEDLVKNPLTETRKLMQQLGIETPPQHWEMFNFKIPSASNFKNHYKKDPHQQLESFLAQFSKQELQRIQDIFDYFNFNVYSAFNAYPQSQ